MNCFFIGVVSLEWNQVTVIEITYYIVTLKNKMADLSMFVFVIMALRF